jgi:hypothetical protein
MTALSVHAPPADSVVSAVPDVSAGVVEPPGVAVDGVAVGKAKPGFVGGRVAVTKRGATLVAASGAILMQEDNARLAPRMKIQNFLMAGFYFEFMKLF